CVTQAPENPVCGNKVIEGSEPCDDGNLANGDGCSSKCLNEAPAEPAQTLERINVVSCCGSTFQAGTSMAMNAWAYFNVDTEEYANPYNITSKVAYKSSNPAVATVSAHMVTGIAAGKTTISASYTFNGVTKTDTEDLVIEASAKLPEPVQPPAEDDEELPALESPATPEAPSTPTAPAAPVQSGETDSGQASSEDAESEIPGAPAFSTPTEVGSARPAAPTQEEAEAEAEAEADVVIQQKKVVKQVAVPVTAPQKAEEVLSRLDACRAAYPSVDFENHFDSDGDGLSNKTECYTGTNPGKYDTDDDRYSDGTELNELGTDPQNPADLARPEEPSVEEKVTITDPHPSWILRQLQMAGTAPFDTAFVTAVVFPADREVIADLTADVSALLEATEADVIESALNRLKDVSLPAADEFLRQYQADYDYSQLAGVVARLKGQAAGFADAEDTENLYLSFEQLQLLQQGKVTVGTTGDLSDTEIGGRRAKRFELMGTNLVSNKVYDLVAIATLFDQSTVSSNPVRFGMDAALRVNDPQPKSIGNVVIPSQESPSAFKEIWIGNVRADSLKEGEEVLIHELQPSVFGDTEFGSQVFAVWNSIVLASSVISDSEAGVFAIQAPRNLESNVAHKVTLYAVKADELGRQARSDSVNVFFRIEEEPFIGMGLPIAIGLLIFALGLVVVFIRRLYKHRASTVPEMPGETPRAVAVHKSEEESCECLSAHEAADVFMEGPDENPLDEKGWEKMEEPKGFFAKLFHRKPKKVEVVPESHESAEAAAKVFGKVGDEPSTETAAEEKAETHEEYNEVYDKMETDALDEIEKEEREHKEE
ncbi:MAG: hypothetical protein V1760_00990, partial [Candidatus Peregrinibacteria bacterium]